MNDLIEAALDGGLANGFIIFGIIMLGFAVFEFVSR